MYLCFTDQNYLVSVNKRESLKYLLNFNIL